MVHPNEGTPDGIQLYWNISSFLPFPANYNTKNRIHEQINPSFFADDHLHEKCVSLSAMLISTRFAFCQSVLPDKFPGEIFDPEAFQLELDLNLVVAGIGKYNYWLRLLRAYVSYWSEFGGNGDYSVEQLKEWEDVKDFPFIQRFQSDVFPFSCNESNYRSVCSTMENVLNHNNKNIASLAKQINNFIHDGLSPKQNSDLKKLLKFIRKVLGKNAPSVNAPITTKDQLDLIEKSLFDATAIVTDRLNSVDGNSQSWGYDMSIAIKEVTDWVYASNKELKKDVFYRYTSKEKGCIALLKIKHHGEDQHYLSFSGYNDCSDTYVLKRAGISMPLYQHISNFESVCEHLSKAYRCKITYVPFAFEIREHIERYGVRDRNPQDLSLYRPEYSDPITLEKELEVEFNKALFNLWPYPLDKAHYLVNYSCCERKILAYLKAWEIKPEDTTAEWYIKFYPCIQCSRAIDLWRKDNHITRLVFTIPDLDT